MKKMNVVKTEFYETAVNMGFYGNQDAGLTGKKDNVRKYWEDMFVKILCRPLVDKFRSEKNGISILDLGCGSGEGFELLTHIPPEKPVDTVSRSFILIPSEIKSYVGLDVSAAMVAQGRANYKHRKNLIFERADLKEGLPKIVLKKDPFDIYFSSFASLSHLSPEEFQFLLKQIYFHSSNGSYFIFDVLGKYSPEWPKYWAADNQIQKYTMAYLSPELQKEKNIVWFNVCFWTSDLLEQMLKEAAAESNVRIKIHYMLDRSIFVGRHIDTGIMSTKKMPLRYQVNRLLDHGYRGEPEHLTIDLSHLEEFKDASKVVWSRLNDYKNRWNKVVYFLEALLNHKDGKIKHFIEGEGIESLEEDFKLLAWLFRNSDRFPVADFWASVLGPQVAVILRNIEMSYEKGLGCGHGLVCAVEIIK